MFMPDTTRLIAAGLALAAAAFAAAPVRADHPATARAEMVLHRVAGMGSEDGGTCTADLTYAAPAGKTLLVEAVRAHGFSRAEVKGAMPRFVMTSTSAGRSTSHALTVSYVNGARRYFTADLPQPVALAADSVLTATVELPPGNRAAMTCRFQVEGRLVDALVES